MSSGWWITEFEEVTTIFRGGREYYCNTKHKDTSAGVWALRLTIPLFRLPTQRTHVIFSTYLCPVWVVPLYYRATPHRFLGVDEYVVHLYDKYAEGGGMLSRKTFAQVSKSLTVIPYRLYTNCSPSSLAVPPSVGFAQTYFSALLFGLDYNEEFAHMGSVGLGQPCWNCVDVCHS